MSSRYPNPSSLPLTFDASHLFYLPSGDIDKARCLEEWSYLLPKMKKIDPENASLFLFILSRFVGLDSEGKIISYRNVIIPQCNDPTCRDFHTSNLSMHRFAAATHCHRIVGTTSIDNYFGGLHPELPDVIRQLMVIGRSSYTAPPLDILSKTIYRKTNKGFSAGQIKPKEELRVQPKEKVVVAPKTSEPKKPVSEETEKNPKPEKESQVQSKQPVPPFRGLESRKLFPSKPDRPKPLPRTKVPIRDVPIPALRNLPVYTNDEMLAAEGLLELSRAEAINPVPEFRFLDLSGVKPKEVMRINNILKTSKCGTLESVLSLKRARVIISDKKEKSTSPVRKIAKTIILPSPGPSKVNQKGKKDSRRALNHREFKDTPSGVPVPLERKSNRVYKIVKDDSPKDPVKRKPQIIKKNEVVCKIPLSLIKEVPVTDGFTPAEFRKLRRAKLEELRLQRQKIRLEKERKQEEEKLKKKEENARKAFFYALRLQGRLRKLIKKTGQSNKDLLKQCPDVEKNPGPVVKDVLNWRNYSQETTASLSTGLLAFLYNLNSDDDVPTTHLIKTSVLAATTVGCLTYGTCKYINQNLSDLQDKMEGNFYRMGEKIRAGLFGEEKSSWERLIKNASTGSVGLAACCLSLIQAHGMVDILVEIPKIASILQLDKTILENLWSRINNQSRPQSLNPSNMINVAAILATLLGLDFTKKFEKLGRVRTGVNTAVGDITTLLTECGLIQDSDAELFNEYHGKLENIRIAFDFYTRLYASSPAEILDPRMSKTWERLRGEIDELLNLCERTGISKIKHSGMAAALQKLRSDVNKLDANFTQVRFGNNIRPVTLGVALGGKSQIGKTHFMRHLVEQIKNRLYEESQRHPDLYAFRDAKQWTCWSENVRDDYEQGYVGQQICTTDDAFALKDNTDHPVWLNRFTGDTCLTKQADLVDKGRPYRARVHFVSYNVFPSSSQTIKNLNALHERFPIHVWCSTKLGKEPPRGSTHFDSSFDWLDLHVDRMATTCAKPESGCDVKVSLMRDEDDKPIPTLNHDSSAQYLEPNEVLEKIVAELVIRERAYQSTRAQYGLPAYDPTHGIELPDVPLFEDINQVRMTPQEITMCRIQLVPENEELLDTFSHIFREVARNDEWEDIFIQRISLYLEHHRRDLPQLPLIRIQQFRENWETVLECDLRNEYLPSNFQETPESFIRRIENVLRLVFQQSKFKFGRKIKVARRAIEKLWLVPCGSYLRALGGAEPVCSIDDPRIAWIGTLKDQGGILLRDYLNLAPNRTILSYIRLLSYAADTEDNQRIVNHIWSTNEPLLRININDEEKSFIWGPILDGCKKIIQCPFFWTDAERSQETEYWDNFVSYFSSVNFEIKSSLISWMPFPISLANCLYYYPSSIRKCNKPAPWSLYYTGTKNPYLPYYCYGNRWGEFAGLILDVMRAPSNLLQRFWYYFSKITVFFSDPIQRAIYAVCSWFGYDPSDWFKKIITGTMDVITSGGIILLLVAMTFLMYKYLSSTSKAEPENYNPVRAQRPQRAKLVESLKSQVAIVEANSELSNLDLDNIIKSFQEQFDYLLDGDDVASIDINFSSLDDEYKIDVYSEPLNPVPRVRFIKLNREEKCVRLEVTAPITKRKELCEKVEEIAQQLGVKDWEMYLSFDEENLFLSIAFTTTTLEDGSTGPITRKKIAQVRGLFESFKAGSDSFMPVSSLIGGSLSTIENVPTTSRVKTSVENKKQTPVNNAESSDDVAVNVSVSVTTNHCVRLVRMSPFKTDISDNWETYQGASAHGLIEGQLIWGCSHYGFKGDYFRVYPRGRSYGRVSPTTQFLVAKLEFEDTKTETCFLKIIQYPEWCDLLRSWNLPLPIHMHQPHFEGPTGVYAKLITNDNLELIRDGGECLEVLPQSGVTDHARFKYMCRDMTYSDYRGISSYTVKDQEFFECRGISVPKTLSRPGDCGGVVVVLNKRLSNKIIGIHNSSNNSAGAASWMTKEQWNRIVSKINVQKVESTYGMADNDPFLSLIQKGDCVECPPGGLPLGVVNPPCPPAGFGRENKWFKSHFYGAFGAQRFPTVLDVRDQRIKEPLVLNNDGLPSLTYKTLSNFCKPSPSLNLSIEMHITHQLTRYWTSRFINDDLSVSNDVEELLERGINPRSDWRFLSGLKVDSSPGYIWTALGFKKKSDIIDVDPSTGVRTWKPEGEIVKERVRYTLQRANEGKRTIAFVTAKLKDELTTKKKVETGNTRVFLVVPCESIITSLCLFGPYREAYLRKRFTMFHAVGMNVHSVDAHLLLKHLSVFNNFVAWDYHKFDSSQHPNLRRLMNHVKSCIYEKQCNDKWNLARKVVMDRKITSQILVDSSVFQVEKGEKSGEDTTTEDNNEINLAIVYYCFCDLYGERNNSYPEFEYFLDNVRLVTFGDDAIMSVSDRVVDWFNFVTIHKTMERIGMEITPTNKESEIIDPVIPLSEVSFLKRKFSTLSGRTVMPLEKASIEGTFGYTTNTISEVEIWKQILKTQLQEACLHGEEYYLWFVSRLESCLFTNRSIPDDHREEYAFILNKGYKNEVDQYLIQYEKNKNLL
ncbi:hypothetical protein 1 [Hubei odonate virus 7]|uniref:hypothetical protein 1 n=1 Tax=Hubei odonate virus 7 TaxID=1923002 RepID=UPI00090B196A|nr:hypothetical protein 1 [Hubei odonate virus 7]APG78004.1 hypothetical protein 1 [Hubei odonate virus 7]